MGPTMMNVGALVSLGYSGRSSGVDAEDVVGKLQRTIGVGVQQGLGACRDWGHTLGESSDPEWQGCLERGVCGSGRGPMGS